MAETDSTDVRNLPDVSVELNNVRHLTEAAFDVLSEYFSEDEAAIDRQDRAMAILRAALRELSDVEKALYPEGT
jgi:hypothetical protein